MSVREMDALCYERGIEFDPAEVPLELAESAQGIVAQPAWEGRSLAQELYERRAAQRRERRRCPSGSRCRTCSPSRGSARRGSRPDRCGRAGRGRAAGTTRSSCRGTEIAQCGSLGCG